MRRQKRDNPGDPEQFRLPRFRPLTPDTQAVYSPRSRQQNDVVPLLAATLARRALAGEDHSEAEQSSVV
ncbi:hypothetical protein [Paraburkholderia sp. BCC1884]|uniref:hypothetical protein n=1 Tax=Paraburkholderia sp. BCC1884 TaxID=2562668 RepID=UPI001181F9D6|nr:hypothetical protein [Paraburkholderia sp. BCC1884]